MKVFKSQLLITIFFLCFLYVATFCHHSTTKKRKRKHQKSRKKKKYQDVLLCFHDQKIHQKDVVIPLFDNPIVKKLKIYTKHSQFTKMKVQGNENEKKEKERSKDDKEKNI